MKEKNTVDFDGSSMNTKNTTLRIGNLKKIYNTKNTSCSNNRKTALFGKDEYYRQEKTKKTYT